MTEQTDQEVVEYVSECRLDCSIVRQLFMLFLYWIVLRQPMVKSPYIFDLALEVANGQGRLNAVRAFDVPGRDQELSER